MNTISSVYYGWAFLIVCGGGSYYFAKRSLAKDREQRALLEYERRRRYQELSTSSPSSRISPNSHGSSTSSSKIADALKGKGPEIRGPAAEAAVDPSPGAADLPKSKWEASEPYRSPKGDRFSRFGRESADKRSED